MKTLDLKKDYKYLYSPSSRKVEIVQIPCLNFVMIDGAIEKGQGPSTSPIFQEMVGALYGIAYTLKFMLKLRKTHAVNFPVMALEGLWWIKDGDFTLSKQDNWLFTLMILQPDLITQDVFQEGLKELRRKRGDQPIFAKLKLVQFEEGLCMQYMHIGPYSTELASVDMMKAFALENGYVDLVGRGGKHHEIYMGDPRKANPDKLKTILRHPLTKV